MESPNILFRFQKYLSLHAFFLAYFHFTLREVHKNWALLRMMQDESHHGSLTHDMIESMIVTTCNLVHYVTILLVVPWTVLFLSRHTRLIFPVTISFLIIYVDEFGLTFKGFDYIYRTSYRYTRHLIEQINEPAPDPIVTAHQCTSILYFVFFAAMPVVFYHLFHVLYNVAALYLEITGKITEQETRFVQ